MTQSSKQVGDSAIMVNELNNLLADIRRTVNVSSRHINDIVHATTEQSQASSEIACHTQGIAVMAEQNHSSACSTTVAAKELAALAGRLSQSVAHLTT
jgi:methyl-accepting chemotaxis protein